MHDPPHVDVPVAEALLVLWKQVHVFGHQQGLLGRRGISDGFCGEAAAGCPRDSRAPASVGGRRAHGVPGSPTQGPR